MLLDPITQTEITDDMIWCEIEMLEEKTEHSQTEQAEIVYLARLRKLEARLQEQT